VVKKRVQRPRKLGPGIHASRRPKKSRKKLVTFWVSEDEKDNMEKAAAARGVSMSRFVMEKAMKAAKKILSESKSPRPTKVKSSSALTSSSKR
jgi:uncharacterized protein (DUF1778 family)